MYQLFDGNTLFMAAILNLVAILFYYCYYHLNKYNNNVWRTNV